MAFHYSCFISYPHGQTAFIATFIKQLKETLEYYLDPLLDLEKLGVYVDRQRLQTGYLYNEALASAICQSICMIVVYSPNYRRRSYCLREYEAMERLEQRRIQILGRQAKNELGMIIPIIFRGEENRLPPKVAERISKFAERISKDRQYCDFSRFTTATTDISKSDQYVEKIEEIARFIYRHYEIFESLGEGAFDPCDAFELPSAEEVEQWRVSSGKPGQAFPGHVVEE